MSSGSDLERVTVRLVPNAATAVRDTAALLGVTGDDVVNRAVQLYAMIEVERHVAGADLALVYDEVQELHRITLSGDAAALAERVERRTAAAPPPHPGSPARRRRWPWGRW